jgi:osmotically inducible lipoprotein OsmB
VKESWFMTKLIPLAVSAMVLLSGCANMSSTEQRAVSGTGIGAAGGAVIGALAGNAALGAGIGAAAGLASGLLVDQVKKSEAASYRSGYEAGAAGQPPSSRAQ